VETFLSDIRYGLRMLLKTPGFTAVAVLTLALGIGANTAIFSVINSFLLRPLPFRDPGRLVQLWETESAPGNYPLTGPDYLDWQTQNRTLEATSFFSWDRSFNASGAGEAESAVAISTQANFFSVLGVSPILGRAFDVGEDQQGKNHVAILSYAFWQRHFGGAPDVLGKTIELNNEAYTVIGVMPTWFNFPSAPIATTDIWTPYDMSPKNLGVRGEHSYRAIGRLKSGVTLDQARADLQNVAKQLEKQYPNSNEKVSAVVVPLKEQLTGNSRPALLILFGAVALVLLVACANVANLLLARATGRQREIAVRGVLGASRWRLMRQLLTESLLLSLTGAALGLAGAWWCVAFLQSAKEFPLPKANPVELDFTVLTFTIGVSILVGVLFGLAPALQVSQVDLTEELKSSALSVLSPSGSRRVLRDALVVGEIAVSLALLVGAGLLLRSFAKMRRADIGVQAQNVTTMGIVLPPAKYTTLAARRTFFDQLTDRVGRVPGVEAVAVSSEIPLEGGTNGYVTLLDRKDPALESQLVEWNYITSDYFRAFGIPFIQGRNFSPEEVQRSADVNLKLDELYRLNPEMESAPPDLTLDTIINREMARTFFPNQDPIGKVFKVHGVVVTIIGVVGDVKQSGIREKAFPAAYFPLVATLDGLGFRGRVTVKTSMAPARVLGAVRGEIRALDGSLAIFRPRMMDDVVAESMQDTSLEAFLLGFFAALALMLAAVGIYGVMAYLVTQRTREIGIRMALGAQRKDVLHLVLGHGTKLTLIGVAIGIAIALALTELLRSLLFGVSATDPVTFSAVAILLAAVALTACYLPARRASQVDPMVALRYE
jgi:predicted permease